MKLSAVDLNLLPVLDALLETQNVTQAARTVGISQPAMSNALGRLRDLLGDPVLVRHGRSMVPTPLAQQLRPLVQQALMSVSGALMVHSNFDLMKARGTLRIAMSDYWHFALLPQLMALTAKEAPGITIETHPTSQQAVDEGLASGLVDAALFMGPMQRTSIRSIELVHDGYSCVVRRRHPMLTGARTMDQFARYSQVVVTPVGPWASILENELSRRGLKTERVLQTAHIPIALAVVSRTNHITVIPTRIARQAAHQIPVTVTPLPFPTGQFAIHLYWHDRTEHDPLRTWLRDTLVALAREGYSRASVF
ncbi:MAG: LysR family transcriptional regulator [Deltaproteobacteria bacterium]|nr:LysR family transcriptional regulator [Deltaproteobacteria bacterium]